MGICGDIRVGHKRICGYIQMVMDGDVQALYAGVYRPDIHGYTGIYGGNGSHTRIYGISGIYGDILAGHMWIYGDIWVYGEDIWAGPSQPP